MRKLIALLTGVALSLVVAASVFAADYTSEVTDMGASVLGTVTTNAPAIVTAGLLIFGALAGIGILFKALRKTPAKG